MADSNKTKYVKVTDGEDEDGNPINVGYHSVPGDYRLPRASEGESYSFVSEAEAREHHPALFGIAPEADPLTDEDIQEQIAVLQAQLIGSAKKKPAAKKPAADPAAAKSTSSTPAAAEDKPEE
ncbi:MAG: hypothetical protein ABIP33_06445 [Pseudolysinimonas sp.]